MREYLTTIIFSAYKIIKIRAKLSNLRLGRDGERAVGQFLELLRENGCKVFHDILGDNFNIDHVLVCKCGIFSIETKTYSKPSKGQARITFDGTELIINGAKSKTNIIVQAISEAKWLNKKFKSLTGQNLPIKPVVLFPGWFIETTSTAKNSEILVLNPKAFRKYIESLPEVLNDKEVMFYANNLSRYIRTNINKP